MQVSSTAGLWLWFSNRNTGRIAIRNARRGQIIIGRRPNRSASAPPAKDDRKPAAPFTTVNRKAISTDRCRVFWA